MVPTGGGTILTHLLEDTLGHNCWKRGEALGTVVNLGLACHCQTRLDLRTAELRLPTTWPHHTPKTVLVPPHDSSKQQRQERRDGYQSCAPSCQQRMA